MNKRIYLDYAASAPMRTEVLETLCAQYSSDKANASSLYQEGKSARQALERAREEIALLLGAAPQELYFCSGGTEAAGTLIEGITRGAGEQQGEQRRKKHILCAAFEHHAVLDSALSLKRHGYEIELLRPGSDGRITPDALEAALRPDTLFATVMWAQNEVGTVQDIAALAAVAKKGGALFVSDCVQGFGKLPSPLADMGVDAACISAHKLGGPFGVGGFYLKSKVPFLPRQLGGGQENKKRSGTQDVPGALGFACAATLQTGELLAGENERLVSMRDDLLALLVKGSNRIRPTVPITPGDTTTHLAGYLHILVQGIESQTMVLKLDELGFAVSGGSACSSSSLEPSHVLTSMGISKDDAYGALRISMGRNTSPDECEQCGLALLSIL